jgi:hypothetical protein
LYTNKSSTDMKMAMLLLSLFLHSLFVTRKLTGLDLARQVKNLMDLNINYLSI